MAEENNLEANKEKKLNMDLKNNDISVEMENSMQSDEIESVDNSGHEYVFDALCKLIPSYQYIAESITAYYNQCKNPKPCEAISFCNQVLFDPSTHRKTIEYDGIMFSSEDTLTFIGFQKTTHELLQTQHDINTVQKITIDKKKITIIDENIYVYMFQKNTDVVEHTTNLMKMRKSCVNIKNVFYTPKKIKIVMLTIGSRGDVQPFISLGLGFLDKGYNVKIVTHECFREFVTSHDIEFSPLSCDPKQLLNLCVNNSMMSVDFMKDSFKTFLPLIPTLLVEAWENCQDANILIATPTSLAGYHIAEKLQIPFFNAFTMPFTYTNEQKNVMTMMTSENEKQSWYTGAYNYISDAMADKTLWLSIRNKINTWRIKTLNLNEKGYFETNNTIFANQKICTLYCYSKEIYNKPLDWGEHIHITGYWRTNIEENYRISDDLNRFLRLHNNPVLISFGSIPLPEPEKYFSAFVNVCIRNQLSVILCKGWSSCDVAPNENVFVVDQIPYDVILPRVKFMIHHGGAGTTASCIYHKKPMLIVPFFGDQFFWGKNIKKLNIGEVIPFKEIDTMYTSSGQLFTAVHNLSKEDNVYQKIINNIGDKVNLENGIKNAIDIIESNLDNSYIPPSSVPDMMATKCANIHCEKVFSVLAKVGIMGQKRHHCRNCGKCFCGTCSNKFIPIIKYRYTTPVRVCDDCYNLVKNGR